VSWLLLALQVSALSVLALAIGLFSCALVSAPSMQAARLGLRGHKRTVALRENVGFALLEPLIRWLSTRLGRLVSPALCARLDTLITRAGDVWGLQPEDMVSITLLSVALSAALGVGYSVHAGSGGLFSVIGLVLGLFGPYLQLSNFATKRVARIQKALPHSVDLLVLGLGAGLDFAGAVRQVVDKTGRADEPLMEELRLLLQELKLGRTRKQALSQLAERVPCEAVRELVSAVVQSEEQGTPLAAVLAAQATASRQRRSVSAEETAARASTALMLPLGILFVAVLTLIVSPMILSLGDVFGG
jgi:tight adherence protein C